MKISEITSKLNENMDLGALSKHFSDEGDFKRQIVQAVDLMCSTYRKSHSNAQGIAAFSNTIGDQMRAYLVKMIAQTYGITNPQEVAHVKSLIDGFISDKYLEYKINDIAPREEYERTGRF
jgi:hypothetical protein